MVWTCEAAKGGAKSVINRKRQRGPGSSYNGNHHSDDGAEAGNQVANLTSVHCRSFFLRYWGNTQWWRDSGYVGHRAMCRGLLLRQEKRNSRGGKYYGETEEEETMHWTLLSEEEKRKEGSGEK